MPLHTANYTNNRRQHGKYGNKVRLFIGELLLLRL